MKLVLLSAILFLPFKLYAFDDPTKGKPFWPWLWEDQFEPTIKKSVDKEGLTYLGSGVLLTVISFEYDNDVYRHNESEEHLLISSEESTRLGVIGSGVLGVSIAISQLFFDQENGLMHGRAIALTAITHFITALIAQRERPGGRGDYLPFLSSFPSGHTASAFASASSLGYAYGWKAGLPAFLVATSISVARITENAHWLSDVVSGAALGIFWARASYKFKDEKQANNFNFFPVTDNGGFKIFVNKSF